MMLTVGAPSVEFLREVGQVYATGPTQERLLEVASRHGVTPAFDLPPTYGGTLLSRCTLDAPGWAARGRRVVFRIAHPGMAAAHVENLCSKCDARTVMNKDQTGDRVGFPGTADWRSCCKRGCPEVAVVFPDESAQQATPSSPSKYASGCS
jgi:hypothetical protein